MAIRHEVVAVGFGFYTAEEIHKLSTKEITVPHAYDDLKQPVLNGLYDPALGPLDKFASCITCGKSQVECSGHFGHIELCVPVYHPLLFKHMLKILRYQCTVCHKFRIARSRALRFALILRLARLGKIQQADEILAGYTEDGAPIPKKLPPKKVVTKGPGGEEVMEYEEEEDEEERRADEFQRLRDYYSSLKSREFPDKLSSRALEFIQGALKIFYANFPAARKCKNCDEYSPNIRADASTKIFELPLAAKHAGSGKARNVVLDKLSDKEREEIAMNERISAEKAAAAAKKKKKKGSSRTTPAKAKSSKRKKSAEEEEAEDEEEVEAEEAEEEEEIVEGGAASHESDKSERRTEQRLLLPNEVEERMKQLWSIEQDLLNELWGATPGLKGVSVPSIAGSYTNFFLRTLLVPPSRFRPPASYAGKMFDNSQVFYYKKIITGNYQIKEATKDDNGDAINRCLQAWLELQNSVNCLFDSSLASAANKNPPPGIRQGMEKKQGLFRMNMMGKRVNFSCRSVISPDPFLLTNEIGIPKRFAIKLSYPEPVTPYNVRQLRQCVINGPDQHPGALFIEDEGGRLIDLKMKSEAERVSLSKTLLVDEAGSKVKDEGTMTSSKKVLRHLNTGDIVLVNRQPTLHKSSIMGHKVRVIESAGGGKGGVQTIRMHYANCSTYNADFDGDEMNVHFPQNSLARAEGYLIANTDNQYLSATSGNPLRGLIQDHVVSGVKLSSQDTLLTKDQFQQLLYSCLCYGGQQSGVGLSRGRADVTTNEKLTTPIPCILKPQPLWSGKQLLSSILKFVTRGFGPLNLKSPCKITPDYWPNSVDGELIVRGGDILKGVIDSAHSGKSKFGLVHAVYELYGAEAAGNLLSIMSRLFTLHLRTEGHTCGVDDLMLIESASVGRRSLLDTAVVKGGEATVDFVSDKPKSVSVQSALQARLAKDQSAREALDSKVKGVLRDCTTAVNKLCLPNGQLKRFPANCMSMMTISGAKGSEMNFSQISCMLGQQELEGRRVPFLASGRTLPSFKPYDPSPRAGGYITDRFLTGIRPQAYYFHCMAGREGLVDTAVKTSRSGYLQRCLIKHLESLTVAYDQTVRNVDGSIVQFHYGEDSVDVTKATYLEHCSFSFDNYAPLIARLRPREVITRLNDTGVPMYLASATNAADVDEDGDAAVTEKTVIDPVLSKFNPGAYYGAISDRHSDLVKQFCEKDPDGLFKAEARWRKGRVNIEKFAALMNLRYAAALVAPGESVGLLCAQGIGEPSTQMTLNTFHMAGQGGRNVTLGIPRLREIIMTASKKISTPTMELPLLFESHDAALALSARLNRTSLHQFVSTAKIVSKLEVGGDTLSMHFDVCLTFHPLNSIVISAINRLKYEDFVDCVDTQFVPILNNLIAKELRTMTDMKVVGIARVKNTSASSKEKEDDEEEKAEPLPGSEEEYKKTSKKAKQQEEDPKARSKKLDDEEEEDEEEEEEDEEVEEKGEEEEEDEEQVAAQNRKAKEEETIVAQETRRETRRRDILDKMRFVKNVSYNKEKTNVTISVVVPHSSKRVILGSVVEQACIQALLRQTPGIQKSYASEKSKGKLKYWVVQTDGVALQEVWKHRDLIDVNRITINDINAMLETYGVEAARATILAEVTGVFGAYGITINKRHLSLLSDYMTYTGGFTALNRIGLTASASPFQKITFETSIKFLLDACINGEVDHMTSPSAKIVMGQPPACGTGMMECMQPLSYAAFGKKEAA